ncbi:hypothetical protein [Janibacter melonis]|uniref:hypothetical protein n=1 Tax=Janibacter melonis TaxID=262209 RepID=UPI00209477F7|nr:hypothetical protein [Janibacter melonis]
MPIAAELPTATLAEPPREAPSATGEVGEVGSAGPLEDHAEEEESDEDDRRGLQRQAEDRVAAQRVHHRGAVAVELDPLEEADRDGPGDHRVEREDAGDHGDDQPAVRRSASR